MKSRFFTVVLILSLALNAAVGLTIAFHWMHRGRPGWHQRNSAWHQKFIQKKLNLTDDQAAAFEKGRQTLDAAIRPLRDQLHQKRTQLLALISSETAYTPEIDRLIGEVATRQMEIEKLVLRHSLGSKQLLTPEQRPRFNHMLEQGFLRMHPGPRPDKQDDRKAS